MTGVTLSKPGPEASATSLRRLTDSLMPRRRAPKLSGPTVGSILYVSQTSRIDRPYFDPSVRYRCFNPAAKARERGVRAWVMSQAEFEEADLPAFEAYVFHRPKVTAAFLERFQRLPDSAVRMADYDDLMFDVAAAEHTSAVRNRGEAIWSVRKTLAANQAALKLFDRFTVSTSPLKSAVERLVPGADVFVLPNRPDDAFLAMAAAARTRRSGRRQTIGYFAGTASHDKDLSTIWRPLEAFCQSKGVTLTLAGPVKPPGGRSFAMSVTIAKLVSFNQLPEVMAGCDFVIAPLINNAFSACKSGIKLMEAAASGTPLVATPIPDIDRFDTPLLHRAEGPEQWSAALDDAWARDRARDADRGRAFVGLMEDRQIVQDYLARFSRSVR